MDPLGLVYEGQGTGGASVLDNGVQAFDIVDWSEKRAAKAAKQLDDAMVAAKAAKEANIKLMDGDFTGAWQADQQRVIDPKVKAFREKVKEYDQKGVNISQDIDAYQEILKMQDDITNSINKTKAYEKLYSSYADQYSKNTDNFEPQSYDNIVKFMAETDDTKRDAMVGKVLVPKYELYAPFKSDYIIPPTKTTTVTETGDKTVTTVEPDMKSINESVDNYIKTEGKDWAKKGIEKGYFADETEAKLFAAKQAAAKVGLIDKTLLDEPKAVKPAAYSGWTPDGSAYMVGDYLFNPVKVEGEQTFYSTDEGKKILESGYQSYSDAVDKAGLKYVKKDTFEDWAKKQTDFKIPVDAVGFQNTNTAENSDNIFIGPDNEVIYGKPKYIRPDGKGGYNLGVFEIVTPGALAKAKPGEPTKSIVLKWVPYEKNRSTFKGEWGNKDGGEIYEELLKAGKIKSPAKPAAKVEEEDDFEQFKRK